MSSEQSVEPERDIPTSNVKPASSPVRVVSRLWWLTFVCALIAVGLVVASLREAGHPIEITFPEGHGLRVGDDVRYRGIVVGAVDKVELDANLQQVSVGVSLTHAHKRLAVEGSEFWIQRPRIGLSQMSGLETVLGAKYIGVAPGDLNSQPKQKFEGLSNPLSLTDGDWSEISIVFPSGEGLEIASPVRYRGISIGEVTSIELSDAGESVEVQVRLAGAASKLATAGTQFWIERPRLDLTEVRGLDTLVAGRYIAMQPTGRSANGPARALQTSFVGLGEAPPLPRRDGSLEVELDAPRRMGLVRGAPVTYRGLEVGRVANVELAPDGSSVKVGVIIERDYTDLVRENSKWWVNSGLEVEAGLRGVNVSIESLSAWVRGGVAIATPPSPGAAVVTGHRFMLEPEPQPAWLDWAPRIAVGTTAGTTGKVRLPEPFRVVARWRASLLGLYRKRSTETWAIAMSDGAIRVPATFIDEIASAGTEVVIETRGQVFDYKPSTRHAAYRTERIELPPSIAVTSYSIQNVSEEFNNNSVFLVINPELSQPLALDSTRVAIAQNIGLKIAPGIPLSDELLGSPVINAVSGKLYGLLVQQDDGWYIARIQK